MQNQSALKTPMKTPIKGHSKLVFGSQERSYSATIKSPGNGLIQDISRIQQNPNFEGEDEGVLEGDEDLEVLKLEKYLL